MRYLIFGAGKMGQAIAHDLLESDPANEVSIADRYQDHVSRVLQKLCENRPKLVAGGYTIDLDDPASDGFLAGLMSDCDVAIGAASYGANVRLAKAAIAAGKHYCDLGGHAGVVEEQFAMSDAAKATGSRLLPDCGVAPGSVSVLAKYAIDSVPDVERVMIRVGGLPQNPTGPLKYAHVFSINGLLGNYLEPTEILFEKKRTTVESLRGDEYQHFPGTLGRLEAAYTADGSSTLTKTYEGRIPYLDYKTLRYEGHWDVIRMMRALGLFSSSLHIGLGSMTVTPREFTEQFLVKTLPTGVPDLLVLRVAALNKQGNGMVLDLIDKMDPTTGHSAMQRTTGYSASICAQMLASGEIGGAGALKHEDVVPPLRFIEEWRKRGIVLTQYDRLP